MEIVLALCAAGVYGVADYSGGRASRSVPALVVTGLGQLAGGIVLLIIVLIAHTELPPAGDWLWGGLAGVAGASGLLLFYRAMGSGFMTVAAPTSAVVAALIPVVFGLAQGERPSVVSLCAIPVGLGAVALISDVLGPHHRRAPRRVFVQAAASGATFGSLFVMLHHTTDGSGLWPVVAMRASSVPYLFVIMAISGQRANSAKKAPVVVIGSGVLDSAANALYLLAVRNGLMTIVAVIVAMYPASTLALAIGVDRERVHRPQILGLALAAIAVLMLTLG